MTKAEAMELFSLTVKDVNSDGAMDTVLSWDDGSITLASFNGVSLQNFLNSHFISGGIWA